jgi:hypothetical protein
LSLAHFLIGLFGLFLMFHLESFFYILDTSLLMDMCLRSIFSWLLAGFFIVLPRSSTKQKVIILKKLNLLLFVYSSCSWCYVCEFFKTSSRSQCLIFVSKHVYSFVFYFYFHSMLWANFLFKVQGFGQGSLSFYAQLLQYHSLEELSFPHWIASALYWKPVDYICLFSDFLCFSIDLSISLNRTI